MQDAGRPFGIGDRGKLRVAIVHEWLSSFAGSERVVKELLELFPTAALFAIVDVLPDGARAALGGRRAQTSFIQKLPFAKRRFRAYLPLMPLAVEQFDLTGYDLVISSSHAVAKGVLTGPDQIHVCYCHTPIRYAWDLQHQYLREAGLDRGLRSALARLMLHYIRLWDSRTAAGVDLFIANSHYIARRIRRAYGREAAVVHPPVDTERFRPGPAKEAFYLAASRLVPYKRMDLIIQAFAATPERRLVVIGAGPEFARLRRMASSNISLLGYQPEEVLVDHLQRARAFVFAAEEDFGILPVEAMACGTPVIAYARGGVAESVVDLDCAPAAATGVLFGAQTAEAIIGAVAKFEARAQEISTRACRMRAEQFSRTMFCKRIETVMGLIPGEVAACGDAGLQPGANPGEVLLPA